MALWSIIHIIEVVNLKAFLTGYTSEDFTTGLSDFGSSRSCYAKSTILGVRTGCCVGVALGKEEAVRVLICQNQEHEVIAVGFHVAAFLAFFWCGKMGDHIDNQRDGIE